MVQELLVGQGIIIDASTHTQTHHTR